MNPCEQKLTYRIVHLNGNTYLLSGLKVAGSECDDVPSGNRSDPNSVFNLQRWKYLQSVEVTITPYDTASSGTVNSTRSYISIGQWKTGLPATYYIYRGFVFFNTSALPINAYLDNATLSLYKKDDYSTTDFDHHDPERSTDIPA